MARIVHEGDYRAPTIEWVCGVRPAGIVKYGDEWEDWERLIEWVIREMDWSHPSRIGEERAFAWEIDFKYVDMREVNWTVLGMEELKTLGEIPAELVKYWVMFI